MNSDTNNYTFFIQAFCDQAIHQLTFDQIFDCELKRE